MALSNLGLIQMGGAMLRPGGSLGDGFLAYGNGIQADAHMRGQEAHTQAMQAKMRMLMQQSQMEQSAARQQQEALRQYEDVLRRRESPTSPASAPAAAATQGGLNGPLGSGTFGLDPLAVMAEKQLQTPAQASVAPQGISPLERLLGVRGGVSLEQQKMLEESGNWGRAKVARTAEVAGPNNEPMFIQLDDFGQQVGQPMPKAVALKMQDLGNAVVPVNEFSGRVQGSPLAKGNSPDSILSANTTMRGQNMTDSRARELAQIQRETNATNKEISLGTKHWEKVSDLRKEFAGLPEVKHFKEVIPAQKSATDAIQRDTAQADINLVYATAKIFDPTSVVREGEYATVNNSAPPAERYQGLLNHLTGGGKLTPATRQALLREINSRAQAAQGSYAAAREAFTGIATRNGFAPQDVFADLPELAKEKPKLDTFRNSGASGTRRPLTEFHR